MHEIKVAESDDQIIFCFPVMQELRSHLKEEEFLAMVRRMQREGFTMSYIESDGKAVAAAGFRLNELFYRGKSLYVDDLVTLPGYRSKGYGAALMDWLIQYAENNGCRQVHLDSGVQRFDAHRFYLRNKFFISSHHFQMNI